MNRSYGKLLSFTVLGSVIVGASAMSRNAVSLADDAGAADPIKKIMKVGFAGEKKDHSDSLSKVVTSGKGTHEDADKLLDLCKALSAATPPKGDPDAWKKRTGDLVAAAEALDKGDMPTPDAIAAYKKAADCKSCHMEFRPPKKK